MQQDDSLALLPGFPSNISQPQGHQNLFNGYGDGTHIDTSFPACHNAATQSPFIPRTARNTTIQTHSGRTPAIDENLYCPWPGCRQSHKEYTASELKFVPSTHIFHRSQRWQDFRRHLKTHTKPKQCPYYPDYCTWRGTAEERELQAHINVHHKSRSNPSFTCSNCAKPYTLQKNLTRHQKEKKCYAKYPPELYYRSLV